MIAMHSQAPAVSFYHSLTNGDAALELSARNPQSSPRVWIKAKLWALFFPFCCRSWLLGKAAV